MADKLGVLHCGTLVVRGDKMLSKNALI